METLSYRNTGRSRSGRGSVVLVLLMLVAAADASADAGAAGDTEAGAAAPQPAGGGQAEAAPPTTGDLDRLREEGAKMLQDLAAMKGEISSLLKVFEFHGYMRAGTGVSSEGGQQQAFQAPGAFAKYRLGNEAEFYGEFGLQANWLNPDREDGAWFTTLFMWHYVTGRNSGGDEPADTRVRQGYFQAGHVIPGQDQLELWAGQRYYRRKDIHINDFYFLDTSSFGGGFEKLDLGFGQLHVAYLTGTTETPNFSLGKVLKNAFDIRLTIPVGSHELELWLFPTAGSKQDDDASTTENEHFRNTGIAGGVFLSSKVMGGFNEVGVQFGYAGAANFSPGVDSGIDAEGWMLRFVDRGVFQLSPSLSMMVAGVFQLDNRNGDTDDRSRGNMWASVGARPVYNFTKYLGLAVEGGVDVVKADAEDAETGVLGKLTIAPVIRVGQGFFSRPELRVFATVAAWNDGIKCQEHPGACVGGGTNNPYGDKNIGATFGIQGESWW
jgi:maltoporin